MLPGPKPPKLLPKPYGTSLLSTMGYLKKSCWIKAKTLSQLVADLCMLIGMQKIWTSPYHPQTNGQCERFNSTLFNMLGMFSPREEVRVEEPHWSIGPYLQLHPKLSYRFQPLLSHVQKTTPPSNRCDTWLNTPKHCSAKYIWIHTKDKRMCKMGSKEAEAFQAKEAQHHKKNYDKQSSSLGGWGHSSCPCSCLQGSSQNPGQMGE